VNILGRAPGCMCWQAACRNPCMSRRCRVQVERGEGIEVATIDVSPGRFLLKIVKNANRRPLSAVSSPAMNQVSDSQSGWLPARGRKARAAGRRAPVGAGNTHASQLIAARPRHLAFFAMFTAIATLAVQTGGDAVMSDIEKRFPFDAYPKGWFQVAYSETSTPGQVVSLHYFGRRLISYRGCSESRTCSTHTVRIWRRYAVGGTVKQQTVSSAHSTAGASTARGRMLRSRTRRPVNRTARLRAWPTVERAGAPSSSGTGVVDRTGMGTAQDPGERGRRPHLPRARVGALAVPVPSAGGIRKHRRHRSFRHRAGVSGVRDLDLETDGHRLQERSAEVTFQRRAGRCRSDLF
jgi:hypothetical protein